MATRGATPIMPKRAQGAGEIDPAKRRRKGNPNWGKAGESPIIVTEFDTIAKELRLPEYIPGKPMDLGYFSSARLRSFATKHARHRYVPEQLLEFWGINVDDITFS